MTERERAALKLAKEATNGWAIYAKRKMEHNEIARLHHDIAELEAASGASVPHPQESYSRSLKENADARSELHATSGTAASGFSPQEAPRRVSADEAELDRQIADYKARCDRGEHVSDADVRWMFNEMIYQRDQAGGASLPERQEPVTHRTKHRYRP